MVEVKGSRVKLRTEGGELRTQGWGSRSKGYGFKMKGYGLDKGLRLKGHKCKVKGDKGLGLGLRDKG